ncbi:MAG: 4Fe-4S binding protein [Bacteroidota bacterium]
MHPGRLKGVRVAVSVVCAILTGALFLDVGGWFSPFLSRTLLSLQFVPSLLTMLAGVSAAALGLAVVLVLTALFGRVYCSSICPLGTLQDVVTWISRKRTGKKRFPYLRPANLLRYGFLLASFLSILLGVAIVLTVLDPYSSFGRIMTSLGRPAAIGANNLVSILLESAGVYSLPSVPMRNYSFPSLVFSVLFLAFVTALAYRRGRLFCNTVCPVGTLLGLFARVAFFRIGIDGEKCRSCGICEESCKAGCIDAEAKAVDFSRCVSCYNCFRTCTRHSVIFTTPFSRRAGSVRRGVDITKRKMMINAAGLVTGLFGLPDSFAIAGQKAGAIPEPRRHPVTPPGSVSLERFTAQCTACHVCITVCPTQVLQPSFLHYGILGILQPTMDYRTHYCTYECRVCMEVCPTGALLDLGVEQKKRTQIGVARFIKDNCVVFAQNTDCAACSEHCPTKAVIMVQSDQRRAPEVREEYCVGCGACEHACPTTPSKAIYVEGIPEHKSAREPESGKTQENLVPLDEFPF